MDPILFVLDAWSNTFWSLVWRYETGMNSDVATTSDYLITIITLVVIPWSACILIGGKIEEKSKFNNSSIDADLKTEYEHKMYAACVYVCGHTIASHMEGHKDVLIGRDLLNHWKHASKLGRILELDKSMRRTLALHPATFFARFEALDAFDSFLRLQNTDWSECSKEYKQDVLKKNFNYG